ncbi:Rgp1 [Nesidiocoris tenuis]|uniref:Rgp1 n=1 Tax=Nesidiocoris tenuis TaxID=355587 RepID=A0ABN7BHJ8_9HEMI|nr:Rgp1 [Nesidiocoris tenuis]
MIQISAKLVGGPVWIPGENIVVCLTFRNSTDIASGDVAETLAWASLQIHCLCSTNPKVIAPVNDPQAAELTQAQDGTRAHSLSDTAFSPFKGEVQGQIVLSTKPKIVVCDLQLQPGSSKSVVYTEILPPEAPPSYKGKLVKYSYVITVGAQKLNRPFKLLRIPIRVLAVTGLPDCATCEDSEDLSPSNPFLEVTANKEVDIMPALQLVQNITARRSPNFYNVTNARGKVGRFCLFKQAYRLGEDIVGTFEFTDSVVPCLQLTVTLQCEEHIFADYLNGNVRPEQTETSYSKFHVVCLHLTHVPLSLPIPFHATPAFSTQLVQLKWKLHFEFVTSIDANALPTSSTWRAPDFVHIETMIWDLPVQIYPSAPVPEPSHRQSYKLFV